MLMEYNPFADGILSTRMRFLQARAGSAPAIGLYPTAMVRRWSAAGVGMQRGGIGNMAQRETKIPHIREGFPGQRMVVLPRPTLEKLLAADLPIKMVPSDIGYFPDAAGHHIARPDGCPQSIFILCVRGEGWVMTGGRKRQVVPGQLITLLPHTPHFYGSDNGWTIYWVHAAGIRTAYFTTMLSHRGLLPVMELPTYLKLIPHFEEILEHLSMGYSNSHAVVAMMALGHLLASIVTDGRSVGAIPSAEQRVRLAAANLRSNWQRSVSVPELSKACNLSTSHFSGLFKKITGYSPLDYLLRARMQRAAEMMDNTAWPLKRIAMEAGFGDPLYFSRVFRRIYKLSHTEYRQRPKG